MILVPYKKAFQLSSYSNNSIYLLSTEIIITHIIKIKKTDEK